MEPVPDRELVEAWRAGDRAAGHALFDRYYEPVARFFFNKVDADVARDLIQRTFLGCIEGLAAFRGDGEFRSWLFGIAYRQLCRHYRGRAGERGVVDFEQLSVADCGPSPSQHAASGQELRLLLAALQRLPLDYQVVLELHYWESMTTDEIAAALELPPGTARSRVRRGRQLLEDSLAAAAHAPNLVESTLAGLEQWIAAVRAHVRGARG
ncbi:sigma-70 family RNA polymerase sigma factor [Nannocystis sp. SCPEA4]|uniref:RNA polymerase sigma factor n=1 Tax=Nannocystis sp. SCPEA4 TaxID=2996787 RepID=UPI00227179B1|nr:sigma-70 family RNA polymerase sigma factor [Nannocystis sp. SCPEA4]MCY1059982.1 sigma-70 family RNA polymerase sigma factor [Nannocystis sp. SCPEA4]